MKRNVTIPGGDLSLGTYEYQVRVPGEFGAIEEIRNIADGGGFGSIVGRNSFQRAKAEGIELLHEIMDIYASHA